MSDLFRSDNVVVRSVPSANLSRWVVTFDNYGIGHGFDRPGFGEAFLKAAGVSAIHVMGRREDWYQYPEMAEAMAAVRLAVAGADRVMTYGSSMGGYAAIRFADAAGAHAALALSPQYSIDPAKAPFERRWSQDSDRIQWLDAIDGPIRSSIRPIIVYDPSTDDARHVALVTQDIAIAPIRLRHTAHPATTVLAEINLLSSLVLETLSGELDPEAFARKARLRRRESATYLATLAHRQPEWRIQTALSLARHAHDLSPVNMNATTIMADLLLRSGDQKQAIELLEKAYAQTNGDNLHVAHQYAGTLALTGRSSEALGMARKAVAMAPHMAHLHAWESSILWSTDARVEAVAAIRTAMRLDPSRSEYRDTHRRYLLHLDQAGGRPIAIRRKLGRWLKSFFRTP